MRSFAVFLFLLLNFVVNSQNLTASPIKISRSQLEKAKLVSELCTTIPKNCKIVSTEIISHVGGNVRVSETKGDQLDSTSLSYFSKIDKKSKIYFDVYLICPDKRAYSSILKLTD